MKNLYLPPKIVLHIKFESESKKKKKKIPTCYATIFHVKMDKNISKKLKIF